MSISANGGDRIKITPNYSGTLPGDIEVYYEIDESALQDADSQVLVPGSISFDAWAPLTASPVGTDEREVAAHIIEAPVNAVTGNSVEISVQAEHATGIERVEVYANGNVATVTERRQRTWNDLSSVDPDAAGLPNSAVFTVTMDMTGVNAGESVEVRAIAYPTAGVPRILQGDPTVADEVMDVPTSEQSKSVVFTKIAAVDDEVVTIDNTTGHGIRSAIESYNYSNDRMVRFIVPDTTNSTDVGPNWNDSDAAIATPIGNRNKYIPVVVRGQEPNRGVNTYNQNIGDSNNNKVADATAIRVEEGYVQLENFTLYQGHMLINMEANQGCIINDCLLTRELVVIDSFRGTTLTDNLSQYQTNSNDWWTDPAAVPETVVGATRWVFSQQTEFNDPSDPAIIKDGTSFGSPLKAGCGTYILNSTIEGNSNMGNNVVLQRNNVHRNNMQDVASAAAVLNVLVTKSNFGAEVPFLAGGVDKVFDPTETYVKGDRVFGQPSPSASVEDWSLWTLDGGTSTPSSRSANGGAFTTDGSDVGCTWRRTDPHVDGYQPPVTPRRLSTVPPYIHPTPAQPNEDPPIPADPGQGYRILDNVIVQGYDFDFSAFCQPYICTEWGNSNGDTVGGAIAMVDWDMRGQQIVNLDVRSQWQTSMYHWIMRGVNYKGPSWDQYFGLINFPQNGDPVNLEDLAVGERPSDFGKALVLHLEDTNLGNFTASFTAVNEGDDISVWIDNVNNNVTGVTVSTAGTVEGTYGAQSPGGSATIEGLEFVGQTLVANNTFTSYDSITYSWERSDDGSTGWSDISGATSSSYVLTSSDQGKHVRVVATAIGLPPNNVSTPQTTGAIGAELDSLGSFSFTYQGANVDDGATISYTEVTDDSARTGVFLAKGRYEAGGTGSNTFDGTLSADSGSFRLGPGYSDAGDNTGLYGSPTYASTGNTPGNVENWRDFFDPDVVVVVSATKRPGQGTEATFVSTFELDSTIAMSGGYFNLGWSQLGWNSITDIQDGLGVGDEVTITAYRP